MHHQHEFKLNSLRHVEPMQVPFVLLFFCCLYAGELDPGEDKEHDTADDGEGLRAVNVPGDSDATAAGDDREGGAAGTLLRQHAERSSAVRRRRTGIPATDADRRKATAGSAKRQTGNLLQTYFLEQPHTLVCGCSYVLPL